MLHQVVGSFILLSHCSHLEFGYSGLGIEILKVRIWVLIGEFLLQHIQYFSVRIGSIPVGSNRKFRYACCLALFLFPSGCHDHIRINHPDIYYFPDFITSDNRKDQIKILVGTLEITEGKPLHRIFMALIKCIFRILKAAHHDQFLLRPCHGNIEKPHFLRNDIPSLLIRDGTVAERPHSDTHVSISISASQSETVICKEGLIHIPEIESLSHSGEDHNRELKSLGLMYGHKSYDIGTLGCRSNFSGIYLELLHIVDVSDEIVKTEITGSLIIGRHNEKHLNIARPGLSSGKSCTHLDIMVISGNAVKELSYGKIRTQFPVFINTIKEKFKLINQCFITKITVIQRLIQRALLSACPDKGNLILTESTEYGMHHGIERNIVQRIAEHPEVLQQKADFGCLEISVLSLSIKRYSHIGKYLPVGFCHRAHASAEDNDITVANIPESRIIPVAV